MQKSEPEKNKKKTKQIKLNITSEFSHFVPFNGKWSIDFISIKYKGKVENDMASWIISHLQDYSTLKNMQKLN